MKIRILLVDMQTLFRFGMRTLLCAEPNMEVVGEAADGLSAIGAAIKMRPDIVLMAVDLPGMSSFEAARLIKRDRPETKIVFLTQYAEDEYVDEAINIGASGYILKDSTPDQLFSALKDIRNGGNYMSSRILKRMVEKLRFSSKSPGDNNHSAALTHRERDILKMLAEGSYVKEIATILDISVKTVEVHKNNLMRKLGIRKKALLVKYAIEKKIICIKTPATEAVEVS